MASHLMKSRAATGATTGVVESVTGLTARKMDCVKIETADTSFATTPL
ncbi:hypothetical protein MA5S0304_2794 [Mycobacteroides abscessus 5S-0304]|nr:hypothetical protein MA5S0304_2794 [Mycobacteroides abscessus 5S-0304]